MEQYVQPFIEVCKNVFKEFLGAELVEERPYFSETGDPVVWDISGVIGFNGEANGAVVISMKKDLAIKLTDMLTGSHHADIDVYVVDAIGEIINIIAGNAKKLLEETYHLVISLPSIVQGKGHVIKWPGSHTRIICIPFKIFGNTVFDLSVAIETVAEESTGQTKKK
jgi:chemotaxis protein CheX